jgi:hypothetical protein
MTAKATERGNTIMKINAILYFLHTFFPNNKMRELLTQDNGATPLNMFANCTNATSSCAYEWDFVGVSDTQPVADVPPKYWQCISASVTIVSSVESRQSNVSEARSSIILRFWKSSTDIMYGPPIKSCFPIAITIALFAYRFDVSLVLYMEGV